MDFLLATSSRSTFLWTSSQNCHSVRPVFAKMFHLISYSSQCSISTELHFNAALFLKGVGIFPLFCRFPVAPSQFLLFSCFALWDQLQCQCGEHTLYRSYICTLHVVFQQAPFYLYVTMLPNNLWWHLWLALHSTCLLVDFMLLDNDARLEHHLSSYVYNVSGFCHIIIHENEATYIVFFQMPKIRWNFNESQWENGSLQWLRRYKVRANKHAGCWK